MTYFANDFQHLDDLYAANLDGSSERPLTHLNAKLWAGLDVARVEHDDGSAPGDETLTDTLLDKTQELDSGAFDETVKENQIAARRSPVEMCTRPSSLLSTAAWVPLPAPGGPTMTIRTSAGTLRSYAASADFRSVSPCPAPLPP